MKKVITSNWFPAAVVGVILVAGFLFFGDQPVQQGDTNFDSVVTSGAIEAGTTVTAGTGATVTSGGLTVTAGGLTVTAGDSTINGVTTWGGGQIELAETAITTDTITASECGKMFFLDEADGAVFTLPAISTVSAGCAFRFVISDAPTTSTVILTGNSDEDVLAGGINELEVDTGDDGPYDASADTITFVGGTAVEGDFVYLVSDGSFFYVSGQANADGGITITDSD